MKPTPGRPLLSIIGLSLALLAAPALSMVRMAVIIGNNTGLEDDKPLQYATRDADQVHSAMIQLGGVDKGCDYLLLEPDVAKVMPIFEDARRRILALRGEGQKVQLLIYYSGHGSEEALHLKGVKLPLSRIKEFFNGMEADLKILIADACFSGSLIQPKGARLIDPVPVKYRDDLKVNGSAILTSSSAGEFSQESKDLQGSLFTHYFLTAIRGAGDADHDGAVSLWEAYNYTQAGLRQRLASVNNVSQNPEFDMDLRGSQNVVLTRLNLGQAFLAFKGVPEGRYRILETVSAVQVAEVSVADSEGVLLALPRGSYMVFRGAGDKGSAGFADLRKMKTIELKAADFSAVPASALTAKGMAEYARPNWSSHGDWQFALAPRYYASFPGRDGPGAALDFALQSNFGRWGFSAAFDYLFPVSDASPTGRFEQTGFGFSGEARLHWGAYRAGSFYSGPRIEAWSLGQVYDGTDLGRGNLIGSFAVLGMERRIVRALAFSLGLEPGVFWSFDAKGEVRRDFAAPVSLSFRYGF